MTTLKATLDSARRSVTDRTAAARAHRTLEREIAGFTTTSERAELEAILARHAPEQTREIDAILVRQRAARMLVGAGR